MFLQFFTSLRDAQVPVTLREYLTLMEALNADLAEQTVENFYYLSRASLVKDERNLDKFDRVFGTVFKGLESLLDAMEKADIPAEWLKKLAEKYLTEEEKKQIEAMGWDKLMETLRQRLKEQQARHQGGNKWIGTAGTSPFGAHGYNPEGIRIGQEKNRNFRAVKVWDRREFKDLDGNVELGIRNIKIALRRLRKFARTGAPDELDLDTTIRETANHGYLDVYMRPERRNAVKVLVFFDIGGSMDSHIEQVEELFSAAKTEFKHMEYFYFHNCLYEGVWKQNRRRFTDRTPTWDVLHKYPHDYKVVFVGDASMSPYEIMVPGGSVEHVNEEFGIGLARAHHPHLSACGVAQSGGAAALGLFGIDHHYSTAVFRAHVPDHDRGSRGCDEGTGTVVRRAGRYRRHSEQTATRADPESRCRKNIDGDFRVQCFALPRNDGLGGRFMPQTIHRGIKSLIDEANAQIETVSAADAIKAAQSDDVVIVDIRDPREIERDGRIPGAFSCTRGMLEFWIDPASPYAKPIFQGDKKFIFHCAGGMRSALAAKTAQDMGLKPVAHMGGGFAAWRDAGGPVEKVEPKKPKG